MAETPDALDWLEGGELVCTTGYALQGDPKLQADWISGMAEKGVAAMIFKTMRFFGSLPDSMIELADDLGFPIIEIPMECTWPMVIEGITSLMLGVQTRRINESFGIYDQLTQLVLTAKGLEFMIEAIARMTKNPVLLEDRFFNAICRAGQRGERHQGYIKKRLRQDSREEIKHRLKALDGGKTGIHTLPLLDEMGEIEQLITPIFAGEHLFGYLTVLIVDTDLFDREIVHTIMRHGATALALELLIDNTRFELNTKEKAGLLRQLTGDTMPLASELKKRGGLFGIDFDLHTAVIVLHCRPEVTYYAFDRLERYVQSLDPGAAVFLEKKHITIFYHPDNISTPYRAMEEARAATEQVIAHLERDRYTCYAGIGNTYSQPEPMRKSYFEAMQCMKKAVAEKVPIVCQDYRRFASLVPLVQNQEDLHTLAQNLLGTLITYDREKNTELTKTLHSYFRHRCSQAATAKALNIHVNTLIYRITRIEELLAADLDDMEICAMLFFALQILDT